ncbi:MAG: PIN domain-containing protein [Bergeyella sp.]
MILVVDANIIFSALLNPKSNVGEILMNFDDEFEFYAPELLVVELDRYSEKIEKYSKLSPKDIQIVKNEVLNTIKVISEELISEESWRKAWKLTQNVDENDTPFIALSIELNAKLWTGDKKLLKEIEQQTISTKNLKSLKK